MGPGATHVYVAQRKGIVTTLVAHRVAQSAASTSHTLFMFNRVHSLEHVENDRLTSKNRSEYSDSSGTFPQCLEYISSPEVLSLTPPSCYAVQSSCLLKVFPDESSGPHDGNSQLFFSEYLLVTIIEPLLH